MTRVNILITLTSLGLLGFIVVCQYTHSLLFAMVYFLILLFTFFVMVYSILRYGTPSSKTFDEKFYDDVDLGPGK